MLRIHTSDGENEISGSSSDSAVRHSHQKSESAFKTWLRTICSVGERESEREVCRLMLRSRWPLWCCVLGRDSSAIIGSNRKQQGVTALRIGCVAREHIEGGTWPD
ncbi:hypothetical protein IRJ41_000008 [Triplophysa rosa]|uniref:Uncharacterized protein n=1 Tax=Triplophysa rosa TaxID=992332 RepID=A0A9W7WBE8_TRIRA|nr:hypothetical protein IRJ41_000008 [Triplophysa rosa]